MANNIPITAGAGTTIRTDQGGSGAHMQVTKIGVSAAGDETFIPATAANGLTVDVTRVQGVVIVNNPTAANLKVDASGVNVPVVNGAATTLAVSAGAATPVAVRLSTGAAFIDTIPVSIAATVVVSGAVSITGTAAVTQSGTWNVGTVTSITNPVTVTGTVAISGTVPISGTITVNQGTAAVIANAWVTKITDGVNPVGVTNVGGAFALKVDVIKQVGGGVSQQDRTTFTDGTTFGEPVGGVYNDAATAPGVGQFAAARISLNRGFHVNIRKNDGTELGIAATPVRIDPTGATTQPVSGTVTVTQGATPWVGNITQLLGVAVVAAAAGIQKVGISDAAGAAFSSALGITQGNPLPVQAQPTITGAWRFKFAYTASLTDQVLHTPGGGKTTFVEGFIITPTAAGGLLRVHDGADAALLYLYFGQPPLGSIVFTPPRPIALSAINNVLRWSTGAAATGDVVIWGYDA